MDSSDSELISIETTNIENVHPTEEYAQEKTNKCCKEADVKENPCKELIMEVTGGNQTEFIKQKETIEILNVELVAPMNNDHVEPESKNHEIDQETELSEILDSNVEEVASTNQMDNENFREDEMISTDANFGLIQKEEKENLNRNTDATAITKILDTLDQTTNSLGLLAQYCSDDDNDSVIEVPTTSAQDYRSRVVEIDSDSSDESSGSSDVEYLNELRKTIEKRIEIADEDEEEDDNEDNGGKKKYQPKLRVKGEMLLEDLPPIQELQITVPEDECIEFGKVHSIVDQLVLVNALPNAILLDLETVIFLEKGQKVLGEVFDVLGQVADPLYCVRFNSNKQIKEKQINIGDVVYVAPKTQYMQYLILSNLIKLRGSDASWENDMEPPPRFLDYSDDEQEQVARRQLRNKDRPTDNEESTKRPRNMSDDVSTSNKSNNLNAHQRNRPNEQRNTRGGLAGYSNMNGRPRSNGPPQNQHNSQNHHRSSWHSNYYPQSFASHPTYRYGMRPVPNQSQSSQPYSPDVPPYHMPPAHMPYSTNQPTQYGPPIMFPQHSPQLMPNAFSVPPSTFHGPPHQYSSNPPPPPGSQ